jgi:hypothetical protein
MVVYTCGSSYLGGKSHRMIVCGLNQAKAQDPIQKQTKSVTQVVEP